MSLVALGPTLRQEKRFSESSSIIIEAKSGIFAFA
jgi:hypothetical protein